MKIEIAEPDEATFWKMLEGAVSDLGSAINGNTIHLHEIGKSPSEEETVLEYARYLTLYRKLKKFQKPGAKS